MNERQLKKSENRIENTALFFCKKINSIISSPNLKPPAEDNSEIFASWIKALIMTTSSAVVTMSELCPDKSAAIEELSDFVVNNFQDNVHSIVEKQNALANSKLQNDIKKIVV